MGTLRVAFLSGAVLELAATLGVALVAVTVGVRLVDGEHRLRRPALTVLVLAPELYLPLRNLGGAVPRERRRRSPSPSGCSTLLDAPPAVAAAVAGRPPSPRDAPVALEAVSFAYPTATGVRPRPVDLELAPGRDGRARRPERRGQEHGRDRCCCASPSRRPGA